MWSAWRVLSKAMQEIYKFSLNLGSSSTAALHYVFIFRICQMRQYIRLNNH